MWQLRGKEILMNHHMSDMEWYKVLARQATAESCVLLENKNNALRLEKGEKLQYTDAVHLHPKVGLRCIRHSDKQVRNVQQFVCTKIGLRADWRSFQFCYL